MAHVVPRFFCGLATAVGAGHAEFSLARGGNRPQHHWLLELGGPGLWREMDVGPAGGPHADPLAHAPAGAQTQLVDGVATGDCARSGGHGAERPFATVGALGRLRFGGGHRFGHTRHRTGRLPHRIGRGECPSHFGGQLPDGLPPGHDLGRGGGVVGGGLGARRTSHGLCPIGLASGLPGHGTEHAAGHGGGAGLARAGACTVCAGAQRGRMAQGRGGRALCRFLAALPLAGGAVAGADRGLPHQRRGHGHHGQPVLCGHGFHQKRSGQRDQGLRRHHDLGRCVCRRCAVGAAGRHACAHAGRGAQCCQQFVVCLAQRRGPRCAGLGVGHLGRQSGQRHCFSCLHCLFVLTHQHQLFGHAIRAAELHDAAAAQDHCRVFGGFCECPRLRQLLHGHGLVGPAGVGVGGAGVKGACAQDLTPWLAGEAGPRIYPALQNRNPGHFGLEDDHPMQQLLMIEDDVRLAGMVADYLGQNGFGVSHAPDAHSGLARLQTPGVDLVILDLMLPDMDGLQVCQRIRALTGSLGQVPVLMLTAKGDPMDRIIGLEMGADDYLPKPFEPRELLARIKAILRRKNLVNDTPPQLMQFGSLEIDRDARRVSVKGQEWELTSYQYDLLVALAERAGRVLTRDQIMEAVRGRELEAFDRSIDVHMGRIRAAIEVDPKSPQRILTVRGVGYVFARQQD